MARSLTPQEEAARRRAAWVAAQKTGWGALPRHIRRALLDAPGTMLSVLAVVGLICRLAIRDRWPGVWSVAYYITPPIVLAAVFAAAGGAWLVVWRRAAAAAALGVALVCLVWAWRATWGHSSVAGAAPNARRLVFWNVAHGKNGWEQIVGELRAWDADVIGLVESTRFVPGHGRPAKEIYAERKEAAAEMEEFWRQYLPEYQVVVDYNGISLLVRGEVVESGTKYLAPNSRSAEGRFLWGKIRLGDRPLHVLVVDLTLGITDSRVPALRDLCRAIDTLEGEPVVVLGDFNTPMDAAVFEGLRQRLLNAFELRGRGYGASWPVPLPVLTLDQAWFGNGVQAERCAFGWTRLSDHRPLVLEISLP